jgi:TonB family protein
MLRTFGAVVAALMAQAVAFGQGSVGTMASPNSAAPPPQPAGFEARAQQSLVPTRKVDPTYPERARLAGVQGDVWLEVSVLADGTVKSVMVAKSLDTVYGLDQAAIAAVRQWRYPPLTDGRPSRPPLQVVIPFRLASAPPAPGPMAVEEFDNSAYRPVPNDARVVPPKLVRQVPPAYTTAGMRAKIVGEVEVDAVVLPNGTVGQERVVKSLDKPTGLDDQALGAAREWMFSPGTIDGKPVSMRVRIVLTFSLR